MTPEFSHPFQEAFPPIAEDHCGGLLFVDLRPGPPHGGVTEWDHEQGALDPWMWASVADVLAEVAQALHCGTRAGLEFAARRRAAHFDGDASVLAQVCDGRLQWVAPA